MHAGLYAQLAAELQLISVHEIQNHAALETYMATDSSMTFEQSRYVAVLPMCMRSSHPFVMSAHM